MNAVATLILVVACFSAYVYGENHLICKQMDEVFTSQPAPTGPSHSYRFRPGKRGVEGRKGEKGENGAKGEKGEQATIDFATINATIKEYISEMMTEFEERKTKGQPAIHLPADCPIPYNNKCYVPKTDKGRSAAQASDDCNEMSGKLADIHDKAQLNYLMKTIRSNHMDGKSIIHFWTGMTMNPQNGEMKYSDGRPAQYLLWYPGYPSTNTENTRICMAVSKSPTSTSQYLWNYRPTYPSYYPLCEI